MFQNYPLALIMDAIYRPVSISNSQMIQNVLFTEDVLLCNPIGQP